MEKLRIQKRDPQDSSNNSTAVRVSRKALALVADICEKTNRSQLEIASRLIEWAYEHVEVVDDIEE